jgi:hypothetical protein
VEHHSSSSYCTNTSYSQTCKCILHKKKLRWPTRKTSHANVTFSRILRFAYFTILFFLIEKEDIGEYEQDKESNSKAPLEFEYIFEDERRLENIAK